MQMKPISWISSSNLKNIHLNLKKLCSITPNKDRNNVCSNKETPTTSTLISENTRKRKPRTSSPKKKLISYRGISKAYHRSFPRIKYILHNISSTKWFKTDNKRPKWCTVNFPARLSPLTGISSHNMRKRRQRIDIDREYFKISLDSNPKIIANQHSNKLTIRKLWKMMNQLSLILKSTEKY